MIRPVPIPQTGQRVGNFSVLGVTCNAVEPVPDGCGCLEGFNPQLLVPLVTEVPKNTYSSHDWKVCPNHTKYYVGGGFTLLLGPSFVALSCSQPKTFLAFECVALDVHLVDLLKVGSSKVQHVNPTGVPWRDTLGGSPC